MNFSVLQKLVSFHSYEWNPDGKYDCISYIKKFCEKNGFVTLCQNIWENYILFIANKKEVIQNIQNKKIHDIQTMTVCHCDVVPWSQELFTMKEDEKRLYGRGVLDMKGALSVCLLAWQDMSPKLLQTEQNHLLVISTDEETWSNDGIQYLTSTYDMTNVGVCYIPDTGEGMKKVLFEGKGFFFVEAHATGQSSHWCRPRSWDNAIEKLLWRYTDFKKEIYALNDNKENGFDTVSINIWKIIWGTAPNQVPYNASCLIDIRFPPTTDAYFYHKIQKILQQQTEWISIKIRADFCGFLIDTQNHHMQKYITNLKKIAWSYDLYQEYWSNDGRFFVWKSDLLLMTWPYGQGFHAEDEKVDKSELLLFYKIYTQTLSEYL